jgi:hypothetical protein
MLPPVPAYGPPPYASPDAVRPLVVRDPLLDHPMSPDPGWFATLEMDLLVAHIKNRLQTTLQVDGFDPNLVHVPPAALDWTGSPRIEVGYGLSGGCGELIFGYRYLSTDGTAVIPGFDLDGSDGVVKSRLNMNVFDFDYASREYSLDSHWDLKWRAGARLAAVFFDSRAEAFFLEQKASNDFVGAGPHVGLDVWRSFDWPGIGLFARVDGGILVGQVSQGFEEIVTDASGNAAGAAAHITSTQAVPVLNAQFGIGWVSCWHHHWSRLLIGYQYEHWWDIGNAADSRADLTTQGVFFTAEFGF